MSPVTAGRLLLASALGGLLGACSGDTPLTADQINLAVAQGVVLPRFDASAATANSLAAEAQAYCADADTTSLAGADGVRASWREAWAAWQAAAPLAFGPLNDAQRLRVEFFPDPRNLVEARVDVLLAGDAAPSEADIDAAPAPLQGFPALEYLLFAERDATPNDCAALVAISSHLAKRLEQIDLSWPAYIQNQFAVSGDDGLTALVEAVTRTIVAVRDDELGVPLGVRNGNAPLPGQAAAPYAEASLVAIQRSLETLQALVNGNGGAGLAYRMRTLGAGTYVDDLNALLRQTQEGLQRVTLPFGAALVDAQGRSQLYAVHDGAFRALRNTVQDLGGAVGVTPGFNADDGD